MADPRVRADDIILTFVLETAGSKYGRFSSEGGRKSIGGRKLTGAAIVCAGHV